jgi:choline dehydrogenase-like flavoprotein
VAERKNVIVVGSGAGGAVAAYELTKSGHNVTIIEEGGRIAYDTLDPDIGRATVNYYRYGGALPILAKPMIGFVEGRAVGGTTTVNGGLFWRTPSFVLDEWVKAGQIPQKLYDDYDRHFTELEAHQNVTYFNPESGNLDSRAMKAGADALGWKVVEVPRSLKNCQQRNRCPAGCPSNAKRSVDLTYLDEALTAGAHLLTHRRAEKFRHKNGVFQSLLLRNANGQTDEIAGDCLVLSAGVMQTPALLRRSGVSKNIGNALSLHANLKCLVFFREAVNAEIGTMFTYQVQEFIEQGILSMPTNFNQAWALGAVESRLPIGQNDADMLMSHSAIIITQIRPKGRGIVRTLGPFGTIATFSFTREDYALMRRALRLSGELFFASGATHFYLPVAGSGPIASMAELDQLLVAPDLIDNLELISVHAMSTCPMGADESAPVNHEGVLKGFSNIHIADASVLPTNIGESPQGTIMYFARHVAESFNRLHGSSVQ